MDNLRLNTYSTSSHQPVLPASPDRAFASLGKVLVLSIFVFVVLFLAQLAIDHFRNPGRFPIRSVVVEGVYQFADQGEMRERVMTQASRGFFNLDIDHIQQRVEELPWVKNAYVRCLLYTSPSPRDRG